MLMEEKDKTPLFTEITFYVPLRKWKEFRKKRDEFFNIIDSGKMVPPQLLKDLEMLLITKEEFTFFEVKSNAEMISAKAVQFFNKSKEGYNFSVTHIKKSRDYDKYELWIKKNLDQTNLKASKPIIV